MQMKSIESFQKYQGRKGLGVFVKELGANIHNKTILAWQVNCSFLYERRRNRYRNLFCVCQVAIMTMNISFTNFNSKNFTFLKRKKDREMLI